MKKLFKEEGPFDAVVHCIGVLLDEESGLSNLNRFASGSGSVPSTEATYDKITRQTAFNALDAFLYNGKSRAQMKNNKPFIFISAAEAGWTFPAPFTWLQRYLEAKRAVESKL